MKFINQSHTWAAPAPIALAFLSFMTVAALLVCPAPVRAADESTPQVEVIHDFDSQLRLNKEGDLDVVETVQMDFGTNSRHGIRRVIPVKFTRYNNQYSTGLRVLSVKVDSHSVPFTVQHQGDDLEIKIGDAEQTISGAHTYAIHYVASRVFNFFNNEPEIYWNATGDEWVFPIEHASAVLRLPDGADGEKLVAEAFRGGQGSKTPANVAHLTHSIEFTASDLRASEGLTLAVRLPKGSIERSSLHDLFWLLQDWWPALLTPITVAVICFVQYYVHGRDPGNVNIAGVDWNPPKELSPAEVGTLIDENCDMADIVSTLVDLAARGYLKIKELPSHGVIFSSKDYLFTKLPEPAGAPPLKRHELLFLAGLFGYKESATLSDVKYKFYTALPEIKSSIYQKLTDGQYFVENPATCRNAWVVGGCFVAGLGWCIGMLGHQPAWGIGVFIGGLVMLVASPTMPARTMKGVNACRQAIGFQRFVKKAEKERIRILAKNDPTIFGRLLPYAMVLGAADQWAESFKDLLDQPPSWYEPYGYSGNSYTFSSRSFVNDLNDGMRTCASTFSAAPSSSSSGSGGGFSGTDGGGFSGGGFGGGGGSSW